MYKVIKEIVFWLVFQWPILGVVRGFLTVASKIFTVRIKNIELIVEIIYCSKRRIIIVDECSDRVDRR